MPSRVCVFVDGENFRHSIVDLFDEFDQNEYLPKKANWTEFFDWMVGEVSADAERTRTYWYVVEHIDFFPYRFPDAEQDRDTLRRLLCRHPETARVLKALEGEAEITKMKAIVERLTDNRRRMENRFRGWSTVHNGMSARHAALEFRKAGAILYNLFHESFGTEKAVDVKLATDLIMLRDIYDVAVIVSGDQDYVPAVQALKDRGKRVVNIAFKTRGGKLLPGGARRLNMATDWSVELEHADLKSHLNI